MTEPQPAMPLTCLIVDDSPEFLEAATQLLGDDGVTVVGAVTTAHEAVEDARTKHPTLVLVDIDLGAENGLDVARQLAELPGGGPHVVLISAESSSELAELVDESGAVGFVSKTDLSGDAIRTLLDRAG